MARFNSTVYGEDAYIIYSVQDKVANASYSYVDPSMRGQGVGRVLVKEWRKEMQAQDLAVSATCGYVHITLQRLIRDEEE